MPVEEDGRGLLPLYHYEFSGFIQVFYIRVNAISLQPLTNVKHYNLSRSQAAHKHLQVKNIAIIL